MSDLVMEVDLSFYDLLTMSGDLSFYDSPELAMVAAQGGLGHPLGQPLHTLLGWLFARLPGVSALKGLGWVPTIRKRDIRHIDFDVSAVRIWYEKKILAEDKLKAKAAMINRHLDNVVAQLGVPVAGDRAKIKSIIRTYRVAEAHRRLDALLKQILSLQLPAGPAKAKSRRRYLKQKRKIQRAHRKRMKKLRRAWRRKMRKTFKRAKKVAKKSRRLKKRLKRRRRARSRFCPACHQYDYGYRNAVKQLKWVMKTWYKYVRLPDIQYRNRYQFYVTRTCRGRNCRRRTRRRRNRRRYVRRSKKPLPGSKIDRRSTIRFSEVSRCRFYISTYDAWKIVGRRHPRYCTKSAALFFKPTDVKSIDPKRCAFEMRSKRYSTSIHCPPQKRRKTHSHRFQAAFHSKNGAKWCSHYLRQLMKACRKLRSQ